MNKKKIEKLFTHNIEFNGDFNNIKDRIKIKSYKKERVSFKDFIFSKRVLKFVCPLVALMISIPFIPSFFKTNSTSSIQTNLSTENNNTSQEVSNAESSIVEDYSASSSSSSSSQGVFYLSTIEVYGVITLNEDIKMFYTDETYGYYYELNKGHEFNYTGYYEISHLNNYNDLEVDDLCVASIVVDTGISDYQVNDIYSIELIEE